MSDTREREEHERLVMEKVRQEDEAAGRDAVAVRDHLLAFLKEQKGYAVGDIEIDKEFNIFAGENCRGKSSTDFIINIDGRRLIAIRCSSSSIESRERQIVSFSRAADEYVIPIAVVTDAETTRILDTATGRLLSEDIYYLPSRAEIKPSDFKKDKCPPERAEKEKRIILAFESISCTTPKSGVNPPQ